MKYRAIKNQKVPAHNSYDSHTQELVIKSLIPSLESRIRDIGKIAVDYMISDESHYGYNRFATNHLVEDTYGAFIVTQETSGYNYNDGGHVNRRGEFIVGVKLNDTTIKIKPLRYEFSETGFVNDSRFAGYSLIGIENGVLSYDETTRHNFETRYVHNGAGVVLSGYAHVLCAKEKKKERKELDLKELLQ